MDRRDNTVGAGFALDNLFHQGQRFQNAGGFDILVGDGILPHPGLEQIIETCYSRAAYIRAHVTVDYQFIANPSYNRDRGPVSVLGLKLHAQFQPSLHYGTQKMPFPDAWALCHQSAH